MFCYQCEQTANGKGCDKFGICGKAPDISNLQDLLIHALICIGRYSSCAASCGNRDEEVDRFVIEGLFTTVTNVNFDDERIIEILKKAEKINVKAKELTQNCSGECKLTDGELFKLEGDPKQQAERYTFDKHIEKFGPDAAGLYHLIIYGLKGTAAYADHALVLGKSDDEVFKFFHDTLAFLGKESFTADELVGKALEVGKVNFRVMELLDAGNTGTFGHPEPTKVSVNGKKGKAILISGHDLLDLYQLLKQTEGKGINIYTHSEMLPANAYPELKKFSHFAGNYGGAWQDQHKDFEAFPGSILMTTNCIQKPKDSYKHRIFTTGLVAWPGVTHVPDRKDFSKVIQCALDEKGFEEDEENKEIMVGFARNAVLSVADKVIDAVKSGAIKHFFLVGGCDGAKPGRNYYTELAEKLPNDTVILTLACGKYRFNKLEFGDIGGIPRLLDVGQCNDAYSAIQIALALANAFETDVNSLPLSLILSWYEQKAVCILLTLLHLGIKNIKLGPSMPAFIKPEVYKVLKESFNLVPITTPEQDIKEILG